MSILQYHLLISIVVEVREREREKFDWIQSILPVRCCLYKIIGLFIFNKQNSNDSTRDFGFFLNKNYIYNPCSFVIIGWFKHYDNDDEHENDTQQALSFIKDDITRLVQD